VIAMMRVGRKSSSARKHQGHHGPDQFIEVHPVFPHKASEALKPLILAALAVFRIQRVCLPFHGVAMSIIKNIKG
jgi:hypothetical protein